MGEIARVLAPRGLFCHETPLMQLLSHPVRSRGRSLPWDHVPQLLGGRRALLWSSRRRSENGCAHVVAAQRLGADTRGHASTVRERQDAGAGSGLAPNRYDGA